MHRAVRTARESTTYHCCSGFATLLLGYTTGGSRAFLTDLYDFTNQEHSVFVQDDWKVSNRITVNAGSKQRPATSTRSRGA